MQSEIKHVRAPDVFVANDVLNLRGGSPRGATKVAVAEWALSGVAPAEAHRRMLAHAMAIVTAAFPDFSFFLMTCERLGRPDSKNARYREVQVSNQLKRLAKPVGAVVGERLIEMPDEYRFFRIQRFDHDSQSAAIAAVVGAWASYIVAANPRGENAFSAILESGWERPDFGPSREVLDATERANGFLFVPTGAFDDREAGCAVLARPALIELLPRP